ncbi:hypothetical protein ASG84_26605 [Rhodococcus sp. Leaf278]|nr:hypothetical protein ASG84_26605 [Rhodococcus sp. Leaf278]
MPFFQLVDELSNNRKIKALLDPTLDGDMSGCAAFTVWSISGTTSQAAGSDGVVKRADVARILLDTRMSLDAATMLVEVGLWHAPGHECPRCPPVADGTFLFHDWFDLRYDTGAAVRLKRRKAAELKDAKIVAAVWARDCIDPNVPAKQMAAQCRYCGVGAGLHRSQCPGEADGGAMPVLRNRGQAHGQQVGCQTESRTRRPFGDERCTQYRDRVPALQFEQG